MKIDKNHKIRKICEEKHMVFQKWDSDFIRNALYQLHGILVLVDFVWEADTTPFSYKIYKFKDLYTREPERVPVYGYIYNKDGTETNVPNVVAHTQYKRSYKDYKTYDDALIDGLYEAIEKFYPNNNIKLKWL